MRSHPRIRKAVKWGGLAVTVVLVAAWLGSVGFWVRKWFDDGATWTVAAGRIELRQIDWCSRVPEEWPRIEGGWAWYRELRWGLDNVDGGFEPWAIVPFWIPLLVVGVPTAFAWRLDNRARRAHVGLCRTCGYTRVGLARSAVCPECGTAVPAGLSTGIPAIS